MKKETAQKLLKLSEDEYDNFSSEFSNTRQFFWRELEFIKKYAKKGSKVLDIGCGNGRLLNLFKDSSINYTGIDSSKKLIEIAKKYRKGKEIFIHGNAVSLPFENETFDTVFSIAVLHHIPSKKFRKQFISEAHRVLKKDGTLVLTVWNTAQKRFLKKHVYHFIKKIFGFSDLDFGDLVLTFGKDKRKRYVHTFTKTGLKTLLKKGGFAITSIQEVKRKSGYANLVIIAEKK